jgi:ADP-ribosyl-[dinitrogen reductase] hydrolase
MRRAPVAIVAHRDPSGAPALARTQSKVTHAAIECLDSADVLAWILLAGIEGRGRDALHAGAAADLSAPKVKAVAEGSWRGKARREIRSSGYVVDTLEAALWAVAEPNGFEEAVLKAVNLGDDADTVGAVAGQVAGAVWGCAGIPERWKQQLAWSDGSSPRPKVPWSIASPA